LQAPDLNRSRLDRESQLSGVASPRNRSRSGLSQGSAGSPDEFNHQYELQFGKGGCKPSPYLPEAATYEMAVAALDVYRHDQLFALIAGGAFHEAPAPFAGWFSHSRRDRSVHC
jgi:hypothetical protein